MADRPDNRRRDNRRRDRGWTKGIIPLIERVLGRGALWSYRQRAIVLVAALIATAAAVWAARTLRIDTDLTHLLPESFESVQSLHELEDRTWGVGYVSVVLEGGSPEARRKAADALAPELEALPTIQYVDFRKPTDFFVDRALFYLDEADLETIRDRIEERHMWEVRKRSPLYDLGLEPLGDPPSLEFKELRKKYEPRLQQAGADGEGEGSPYFEDDEHLVLLARPSRRSSDVGFNDQVVDEVSELVSRFDLSAFDESIELTLSGRYVKKDQQKAQIESDLRLASILAVLLVLGYLGIHFRRPRSVLLVMVPLMVGLSWTFAAAALLFGSLNLLTGFIGALLLGVGIDHGIHLLSRIEQEGLEHDPVEAVRRAFGTTGRAVVAAALTTMVAFFGVAVSEFRAFREFGVIAGVGLVLIVVAYTTVLPALLAVVPLPRRKRAPATSSFARALPKWAPVTGWMSVLAAVGAISFLGSTEFDYDFASLESSDLPAFRLDKKVNRILGRSQTPLVVLADDTAHERAIAAALRTEMRERGSASSIQLVMSLDDVVPRDAQSKKEVIDEIGEILVNAKDSWFDEKQNERRKRLIEMTKKEPFGRAALPEEVRRQFLGREGKTSFVLVYPSISLSDGQAVRGLAEELRAVHLEDGRPLVIAGEAMVLADVLDMVVSETPVVIAFTLGLVVLVLMLLLGPSLVWPCAAAALTTLAVTGGLMPLVGVKLNYLNIIVVPVLFGMAVDGAVHLMVRHRAEGDVVATTSETGRAVAGAILTTALGFGAFALAHHPGLQSLAHVAVLGLAVNLLVCLVLVPSGLALAERFRSIPEGGRWTRLAVTTGLAGDSPVAPGTLGALVAVPLGLLGQRISVPWRAGIVAAATVASIFVVGRYLQRTGRKDPQEVVIDELVGCLIAMFFVPAGIVWAAAAFLLFRVLDIVKPWPIGYIDRRVRGAWGVMGDDVLAGIMAGAALIGLHWLGVSNGWWT
jgi:predicted RND superfamily exporter protein/phosphatidylglycerophosphatase A